MNTKVNILLLEDHRTDADLIGHLLRSAGYDAQILRVDTKAAYENAVRQTEFDVIIADYTLPGYNGSAALQLATEIRPSVPFIFFTGTLGEEAAVEALRSGAADYVLKQRPQRLGAAVQRALKEKRQNEEQRRAESQIGTLIHLINLASDAVIMRDMHDTILFWNEGAARIYGYNSSEAQGCDIKQLIYSTEALPAFREAREKTERDGQWAGELTQRHKDGSWVIAASRWTLMRSNSGRPERILVINSDITDKRKLEDQFLRAQRLESIGTLASGLAHDLNNVLAPVMMGAEIIRQCELPPDAQEIVETIAKSARRGADILAQVLTFARGGEGHRVSIRLKHLLKEVSKLIGNTFPKNIHFNLQVPDDLRSVRADPTQLLQVFMNLCINARDAMPDGGTLTMSARNALVDDRSVVCVSVADSGVGMPAEVLEKAFDPFFTTKEAGRGTGLGLPTVLRITQAHGGTVTARSQVGRGTTFEILIPADDERPAADETAEPRNFSRGRGEMILVVDDEREIRNLIAQVLLNHNYTVLTAEDGNQAIIRFLEKKDSIRLVITDLMMPTVDGISLAKALFAVKPEVKLVATSGLSEHQHIPQAQAFLKKPFALDELLVVVQQVLAS